MARFNAAVERADYLLAGKADRLTVEQLARVLRWPGWLAQIECRHVADELEAAFKALEAERP